MRHQWVRRIFVGLILAFPLLISVVAAPSTGAASGGFQALMPIVAVEMVLVAGLIFARRERHRLLAELETAATTPSRIASRPSPPRVNKANAPAWRSVSGSPGL